MERIVQSADDNSIRCRRHRYPYSKDGLRERGHRKKSDDACDDVLNKEEEEEECICCNVCT